MVGVKGHYYLESLHCSFEDRKKGSFFLNPEVSDLFKSLGTVISFRMLFSSPLVSKRTMKQAKID
jgi:hypothetical protein